MNRPKYSIVSACFNEETFRNDARFARYNYQVKNLFCELLNIVIEKSKA